MKVLLLLSVVAVVALGQFGGFRMHRPMGRPGGRPVDPRRPRPTGRPDRPGRFQIPDEMKKMSEEFWNNFRQKMDDFKKQHMASRPTGRPSYESMKNWHESHREHMEKMKALEKGHHETMRTKHQELMNKMKDDSDETAIFKGFNRMPSVKKFWADYKQKIAAMMKEREQTRPTGRPGRIGYGKFDDLHEKVAAFMKKMQENRPTGRPMKNWMDERKRKSEEKMAAWVAKENEMKKKFEEKEAAWKKAAGWKNDKMKKKFEEKHAAGWKNAAWWKNSAKDDEDETAIVGAEMFRDHLASFSQKFQNVFDSRPTGRPSKSDIKSYNKLVENLFDEARKNLRQARPTGRPGRQAHKKASKKLGKKIGAAEEQLKMWKKKLVKQRKSRDD